MRLAGLTWILGLALAVSGCVEAGGTASLPSAPTSAAPGEEPTGVRGRVLSDELAPIPGALVQVDNLTPVTTAEDGAFVVLGLEPGEHRILVQAIGFNSVARKISVEQGRVTDVEVLLEPIPVRTPYVELLIRDGYDICSYAIFGFIGTAPNPCPLGTPNNAHDLSLPEGWAYFVVENVWGSSESFWVSINTPGAGCTTGAPCPGVEISRSPLRIDGAPEDAGIAARYALDGKKTYADGKQELRISTLYAGYLREEINSTAPAVCVAFWSQFGVAERLGCPVGFGYSTGIRFTQYASIFHWERPPKPAEYSGIPDG